MTDENERSEMNCGDLLYIQYYIIGTISGHWCIIRGFFGQRVHVLLFRSTQVNELQEIVFCWSVGDWGIFRNGVSPSRSMFGLGIAFVSFVCLYTVGK